MGEARLDDALAQVDRAAGELATLGHQRLRATSDFHTLRGKVAWARGERQPTLADFEAAANAADEWCRLQPRRNAAHRYRVRTLDDLGTITNYLGDFEASSDACRRAIAAAEAMVAQFPDDPTTIANVAKRHHRFAYLLWERFRLQPLAEAAEHVARAFELEAALGDAKISSRVPRWQLLTLRAAIEESRGQASAAATWREVERVVPIDAEPDNFAVDLQVAALTAIARMRMAAGEPAAATRWLDCARAIVDPRPEHNKRLVEVAWLEANVAFRSNDAASVVDAGDRIIKARPTWLGCRRAADCFRLGAECEPDPTMAAAHRQRARELYGRTVAQLDADVGKNPDDPWFVIPWGASKVRLAEFAAADGDETGALEMVQAALARLDAARPDAHHDQWDDAAYGAGLALRDRLSR